jgi:hypothetical protein
MSPATDRAAINRANAQLVVMHTEDLEAYKLHLASFVVEYDPQGATESNLVQALADASWRLKRVAALQTAAFAPDPITGATEMAAAIGTHVKALANLSMHTQRLSRQFERTVAHLRALQKGRLGVMKMRKEKGETYIPAEGGFVFSRAQISRAIHVRQAQKFQKAAAARRVSPMR